MVDPYAVLQVARDAEPEVIRAAFRALARKHHPDFGGDPRRMAALNEAWNVLGNRDRRAAHDAGRIGARRSPTGRSGRTSTHAAPPPRRTGPLAAAAERRSEARDAQADGETRFGRVPHDPRVGSVLDFGRYAGWAVRALVDHDPDYLLWLARTPIGRPMRREIDERLAERGGRTGAAGSSRSAAATATATAARARPSIFRLHTR
jgi:curved DNA-binding protein CbpA